MKALILFLLLSACASQSLPVSEAVPPSTVYLPLVSTNSTRLAQPCRYVENTVMISYPYNGNRSEGPFTVVDCVQHSMNWLVAVNENEVVVIGGTDPLHWGIAQQGDPWLEVLIWQGTERPYTLNLTKEEE